MRDTFANMEKSHVSKMERLLEAVNSSAFTDLKTYVYVLDLYLRNLTNPSREINMTNFGNPPF
jgi:hypothetical protein